MNLRKDCLCIDKIDGNFIIGSMLDESWVQLQNIILKIRIDFTHKTITDWMDSLHTSSLLNISFIQILTWFSIKTPAFKFIIIKHKNKAQFQKPKFIRI